MKKELIIGLLLAAVLLLNACGAQSGTVAVQRADQLAAAGQMGDRYAGMVVSDNVVEITRDSSKTVKELYVTVGQEVKSGDKLFSYDSDALELDLEKNQLEVEKMTNEQTTYAEQQEKLEKQLKKTSNQSEIVRLTLEINTLKTTQMENDYNIAAKNQEIDKLKEMLANVDITAPVDGTIRKIDNEGQTNVYITIQQSGAYRIKGTLNEMSMNGGLMVGSRVKVYSRISDQTWMGTVASIDMESPEENQNNYYFSDSMTMSSKYPFYVDLDSVDGLMLGQHVYMEVVAGDQLDMPGLWIPENFLTEMNYNDESGETTGTVWTANSKGKLEKRSVTLGMYDDSTGCFEVLEGLRAEDYVADPAAPGCGSGAAVAYHDQGDFGGAADGTQNGDAGQIVDGGFDEPVDGDLPGDGMMDDVSVEPDGGSEG